MGIYDSAVGSAQGLGIAVGAQAFGPARQAERAEARTRAEASKQQLKGLKATEPTAKDYENEVTVQRQEMEKLKLTNEGLIGEQLKTNTYSAMDRYTTTNDVRHLNNMFADLRKTERGAQLYPQVARVDNLTELDRAAIEAEGLDANEILSNPEMEKSYVMATRPDGTKQVRSVDELKKITGYNKYATTQELERQTKTSMIEQMKRHGYKSDKVSQEAYRFAAAEGLEPGTPKFEAAYKERYDELVTKGVGAGSGNPTEREELANKMVAEQGLNLGDEGYNAAHIQAMEDIDNRRGRPSAVRQTEAADVSRNALKEMKFLESDTSNMTPTERADIEPHVSRIEKLAGKELTSGERVVLQQINELTHLGSVAGELTADQTGIVDSVFRKAKKYISDSTEGVKQEAAYAAFRGIVRHAFFGATVPAGEESSLNAMFGNLGQQRGAVLASLQSQMEQVKSRYETMVQMNDPYVMHYRTGKTEAQITQVIDRLDDTINSIGNAISGKVIANPAKNKPAQSETQVQAAETTLTPERRAGLDALRGGS